MPTSFSSEIEARRQADVDDIDNPATRGDCDRSAQGVLDRHSGRRIAAALATIRVPVSRDCYRALRRFANRWPDPTWALEGAPAWVHRYASEAGVKVTRKRCDALNDGYPTSSTDNSATM